MKDSYLTAAPEKFPLLGSQFTIARAVASAVSIWHRYHMRVSWKTVSHDQYIYYDILQMGKYS